MRFRQTRIGDTRVRHKFCLLPFRTGCEVYWLEWIYILERYSWDEAYGGEWAVVRVCDET